MFSITFIYKLAPIITRSKNSSLNLQYKPFVTYSPWTHSIQEHMIPLLLKGGVMREEAILSQFGRKVKAFRNERDISQEKLAELSKLDRTYISSVERGQRNIGILNIVKIADALRVSTSSLLEGIGDFDA